MPGILAGVLLVYMVLLGGSEAGVFLAPFQVINAVIGAILVVLWIRWMGRAADRVDALTIAALLLFVVACSFSAYPRQSFDSATAALTWAAAFGIGRRLLADPRYRLLCIRLLAVCAALLGLVFAISWGSVWVDWIRLTGTAPPLDLNLPQRIYRHYYVVAMLLAALLPAVGYLLGDRSWRVPAVVVGALTLGLAVLSGSRTVWLALAITALTALLLLRPPRRLLLSAVAVIIGAAGLALVTGLLGTALDRLLTGGTVSYRLDIWGAAIGIWVDHPLAGLGPGAIGIGLALSDLTGYYSFANRHADNALIQLAAEAGVLGVAGAAVACLALFFGRVTTAVGWRSGALGVAMLAALSLTNNPVDSPNLVVLLIVYAALLAPFDGQRATSPELAPRAMSFRVPMRLLTWSAAGVVAAAVGALNLGAVVQAGIGPVAGGVDGSAVINSLRTAVALDPGLALYHRELGVALAARLPSEAIRELEHAVALDPADTAALRALALVRASAGDGQGAVGAARRATEVRPIAAENWIVVALVAGEDEADRAAAEALRLAPWLAGSPAWPAALAHNGDVTSILDAAAAASLTVPAPRDTLSLAWLNGVTFNGREAPDGPPFLALRQVLGCNLAAASTTYQAMGSAWAETTPGIIGRLMLARLVDDPKLGDLLRLAAASQPDLAAAARGQVAPYSAMADPALDQQLYRRMGIDPRFGDNLIPRSSDALAAWMFAPREAAARSMPGSPLADCG